MNGALDNPPPMLRWNIKAPLRVWDGGHRNRVFCTCGVENAWVFKSTRKNEEAVAWRALEGLSQSVVHGDLNCANVLKAPNGRPVLLDWDETRVDASAFDIYAITGRKALTQSVARALYAWEIACCWGIEPEYASELAGHFMKNDS